MSTTGGKRWAVVGGGLLGMSLANRLAGLGYDLTLIEAAPHVGGLASAWRIGDVTWDRHYHVTLLSDRRLRALLAELGLEDELRWVETRTGCYAGGELYSVSNTVEFLRFPPLRLVDKLRLGGTILYGSKVRNWRRLEDVPVADWLRRLSGRRTFDEFWLPLLRSKLGEGYRDASAALLWATIQRLYAARRSGLKREMFGYVRGGGYARVNDRFAAHLGERGVRLDLGRPVRRVAPSGGGVAVTDADGRTSTFDGVVVTAAAPIAARLCEGLNADERARLEGIRYQGIVCASLVLRRPLAGYYLTYITDPSCPFTAVVEMTALVDPSEVGGHSLVYLPRYVATDDPLLSASDEQVRGAFLPFLMRMYPTLRDDDVLAFRVSRVPAVFAVPTLGYSRRVPAMATSVPGLFLVNSSQILNGTLNVEETLRLADEAVPVVTGAGPDGRTGTAGRAVGLEAAR